MTDNTGLGQGVEELVRPIIGIEYRSAEEAHAIMADRIRSHFAARTLASDRIAALNEGFRRGTEAAAKVAENVAAECQADEMQCDSEDKAGADWAFGGKIEAKRIATAIRSLSPDVGEG